MVQPAVLDAPRMISHERAKSPVQLRQVTSRMQTGIAIGLQANEPGYAQVVDAIMALGPCKRVHEALWFVQAASTVEQIFEKLNTHLLDRRIAGNAGILVLDAATAKARWHWYEPAASVLFSNWRRRNNLFVSLSLVEDGDERAAVSYLQSLGLCAQLNDTLWYVSSDFSLQDAFQVLLLQTNGACKLLMSDAQGNLASWQHRSVFESEHDNIIRHDRKPVRGEKTDRVQLQDAGS